MCVDQPLDVSAQSRVTDAGKGVVDARRSVAPASGDRSTAVGRVARRPTVFVLLLRSVMHIDNASLWTVPLLPLRVAVESAVQAEPLCNS
jgi:hypothetical protein